jgi:hypothetical protein
VRPVAARLVDSFLKKVALQVIFVVELTNLAYRNPHCVRPVAARFVDTFLKKLLLEQLL